MRSLFVRVLNVALIRGYSLEGVETWIAQALEESPSASCGESGNNEAKCPSSPIPTSTQARGLWGCVSRVDNGTNAHLFAKFTMSFSRSMRSLLAGWSVGTSRSSVRKTSILDQEIGVLDKASKHSSGVLPPLTIREALPD